MEITAPKKGILKGQEPGDIMSDYSEDMNNCRPQDVLEKRLRIGQRPGLDKWGAGTQIGAAEQPVVASCTVSTVA